MVTSRPVIEKAIRDEIVSVLEGITFTDADVNGKTGFGLVTTQHTKTPELWPFVYVRAKKGSGDDTCFNRATRHFLYEIHIRQYYDGVVDDPQAADVLEDDLRKMVGYVYDTFYDRLAATDNRCLSGACDNLKIDDDEPTTEAMEGVQWTLAGHVMIEFRVRKLF